MEVAATGGIGIAIAAAAASPLFLLFGDAFSDDDGGDDGERGEEEAEEVKEGSGEARFFEGDATAGAGADAVSDDPIRSGKLSRAREPRIR